MHTLYPLLHLLKRRIKALRRINPDWLIIAAILLVAMIPIAVNGFKPLWYDEVWRAHIVSSWRLFRFDGEAPMPLLFMLLVKPITLIYNNEFTQRLVYMLFGLGLIPLLYLFGRKIRGRKFGLLLAASLPFTFYYLEYLIENKTFLADIVLTILFIWLFLKYQRKQLHVAWFIGFCMVYLLGSTSSVYLFAAAGMWQLYAILRHKETWWHPLKWALPVGVVYVVYYLSFLKPQITPGLLQFWELDAWRGKPLSFVLEYIAKHVLSSFGFDVAHLWPNVSINFPVDQTGFITWHAMHSLLAPFEWLFGLLVVAWFIIGTVSLIRRGYGFISFAILVTWVLGFGLAYFSIAPFGNSRANLFMFSLMAITSWLGLYETLVYLWHRKSMWAQGAFMGIVVFSAWFVPIAGVNTRLKTPRPLYYLDGMPEAARIVRQESTPTDYVVNFHFMNEVSFSYYYNYDTTIRKLSNHPSENLLFDRKTLLDTPEFYQNLRKQHPTVWVLWGAGMGHDVTVNAQPYYNVELRSTYGYVGVARLTAKD